MSINLPARGLSKWLPAGWVRNAAVALVAIGVVVVGGMAAVWFGSSLSVDQRIAALGAVLTFGALLLAVLAAVVAIAGYRFILRRPRLGIGFFLVHSPDGQGVRTTTITPNINNYGDATATNAKVTFFFGGASIISANQWHTLGGTGMYYEIPTLHVDPTIPLVLPPIVVRIARDDHEARLSWQAVADHSHDSGSCLLNLDGPLT